MDALRLLLNRAATKLGAGVLGKGPGAVPENPAGHAGGDEERHERKVVARLLGRKP